MSPPILSTIMSTIIPDHRGDRLGETLAAGYDTGVEPVALQFSDFFRRARRADNFGADQFCKLQGRDADAGGCCGHKHGLAGANWALA